MTILVIGIIVFAATLLLLLVCKAYNIFSLSVRFSPKVKPGILFGKYGLLLCYSPQAKEGHCAIFGGTGSGKTSALLIPTLRSWQGCSFTIDISGDISKNVKKQNKLVYAPENAQSIPYNVFHQIDTLPNDRKNEALENLAFMLMPPLSHADANARFFNDEGRKILTASLLAFYHLQFDFTKICEKIIQSSFKELFHEIDTTNNQLAISYINSFHGASEVNTAGCKQACDLAIKLFATNNAIKNSVRRPAADENSFYPQNIEFHNVFIEISDNKLELYAPLVHLIISQVLDYFSERKETNTTILLCLDEFVSFGKLEITPALRKLRKRKVRIICLTQCVNDIDLIYGHEERRSMMNNFAFKAILQANDTDTQDYFSKLIGKKVVTKKRITTGKDGHKTETISQEKEWIIEPEQLARLKNKLVLLHPEGHLILRKNFHFKRFF